jgi:hypothetical protein
MVQPSCSAAVRAGLVTKAVLQWTSLEEAVALLAVFLNPVIAACGLSHDFESLWNPVARAWRGTVM